MKKKRKGLKARVFFNASVILSGLRSSRGGSGKILAWSKSHKIVGIVSEVVLAEVLKHAEKIGLEKEDVANKMVTIFPRISPAPSFQNVSAYQKKVVDPGDAHLLASALESQADFLASLDKRHILSLQEDMKEFRIVSPGQLIEILSY